MGVLVTRRGDAEIRGLPLECPLCHPAVPSCWGRGWWPRWYLALGCLVDTSRWEDLALSFIECPAGIGKEALADTGCWLAQSLLAMHWQQALGGQQQALLSPPVCLSPSGQLRSGRLALELSETEDCRQSGLEMLKRVGLMLEVSVVFV